MSLRFRLNMIIMMICFLVLVLGSGVTIINARQSVLEEISSTLVLAEKLLGHDISIDNLGGLNKVRHLSVDVAFEEGRSLPIKEALEGVPWLFVRFVSPSREQLSHWLETGSSSRVIRLVADPDDEIREAWREASVFIGLLFFLTGSISICVFIVTGHALRPVDEILRGFADVEKGNYQRRLDGFNLPEFSRIAKAFNQMVGMLASSQEDNRLLSRKALQVRENERHYLARELHDEMGQSLSAIKALSVSARQGERAGVEPLSEIGAICDHLFEVVRNMMRQLSPSLLNEFGLRVAVEELVRRWQVQSGRTVELLFAQSVDELAGEDAIHLYRIVQESLTNVLKHSQADHVVIKLSDVALNEQLFVQLSVSDNGIGFNPDRVIFGGGLAGIRERAESTGGSFTISSNGEGGVVLTALLMVKQQDG